jgi:hypothetical protein
MATKAGQKRGLKEGWQTELVVSYVFKKFG